MGLMNWLGKFFILLVWFLVCKFEIKKIILHRITKLILDFYLEILT